MVMRSIDSVTWNYLLFTKWILLSCFIAGCICDVCKDTNHLTAGLMSQHIYPNAFPKGELYAGVFEEDKMALDPAKCLLSCCGKPLCNVAWFTHDKCLTIECDMDNQSSCEPVTHSNQASNGTLLIQVRSLAETAKVDECGTDRDCDEHQECKITDLLSSRSARCRCRDGYIRETVQSKKCIPEEVQVGTAVVTISSSTAAPHVDIIPKDCTFGLMQCGINQECYIPKDSKKRFGHCRCVEGYVLKTDNKCVKEKKTVTDAGQSGDKEVPAEMVADNKNQAKATTTTEVTTTTIPTTTLKKTTTPTTPKVLILTVSAGKNQEIQLPENSASLKAFALPQETEDDPYHYDWTLEAQPEGSESGAMGGQNSDTLKLSQLIAGLYTFRVQVTGTNKFGEAVVNVTVKPPARENQAPAAKITPTNLVVKLPNSAILDGSDSTDDDKIVSYHWEVVSGPLLEKVITSDSAILKLTDLAPGNYTLKLTVTDSDGSINSTTANVTAIKETDYPPKANAGSDVVIHLPQNSVVLYGNQSTDDKEIVSYEWIKASSDKLAADMQGARSSELLLSNLEVGDYTFTLKVTDSADQVSTADVHVYVKPEQNTAPVAITFVTIEASLPLDNILLDGSNSTDDVKITSFLWQQTGGPTILELKDADKAIATAGGVIKVGQYMFKLTVKDKEELKSSSTLTVNVKQVANEAPVAHAGGDVNVQLPQAFVSLDGTKSSDDHKITEYHWVRDPKSLAAGDIINSSDHEAVLQLVNLVAGRYVFTLTVMDAEGLSNTDQASVIVKEDKYKKDVLELLLDADITQFTEEHKKKLAGQLGLLLPKSPEEGDTVIKIQSLQADSSTGKLRVQFYAMNVMRDRKVYRNGVASLKVLKHKLLSSPYVLDFKVIAIDTLICQNNCSDHGHCDLKTKMCICEAFWTQNFFLYLIHGESNCDWSILYVVIVCFIIVITFTGIIWGCICCWQRRRWCRCRFRSKKRHRYSLLQDADDENDNIEMKTGKIQNSSVMISESDFSSEEETIFVNQKKTNGHLSKLNGVSKQHFKTKQRA